MLNDSIRKKHDINLKNSNRKNKTQVLNNLASFANCAYIAWLLALNIPTVILNVSLSAIFKKINKAN